jgi:hypothetical protein
MQEQSRKAVLEAETVLLEPAVRGYSGSGGWCAGRGGAPSSTLCSRATVWMGGRSNATKTISRE